MTHNIPLNWLLMAYLLPNTRPGVVADRITAEATLATLRERAFAFACRTQFFDPDLADDALCSMLTWAATSRICERFKLERGTPRQFIDKILSNFVTLEIRKKYRRTVGPLHESLQSNGIDPALDAEIRELTILCEEQLADDDAKENEEQGGMPEPGDAKDDDEGAAGTPARRSPDTPMTPGSQAKANPANQYVRRHRWRKRRWIRVKAFFPELGDRGMRPKRRRGRRRR